MYKIEVDAATGLLDITLGGMMTVPEVDEYIGALRTAFVTLRQHDVAMLIDVSGCPIQSQDMIGAMSQHMQTTPKSRAIAIVTGSSLARMQVRRLFKQDYARICGTRAEGRAWVLDGVEPAVAPLRAAG